MVDDASSRLPSLIVVTGPPGSGKTTLAHALARTVRCPAICRDEIKEGFVHATGESGQGGDDIALAVYETFFETVHLLLTRGVTLVAEAAFQHKVWAPKLEPLRQIARVRIIVCSIDPELARARHLQRASDDPDRERFHPDPVLQAMREGREAPVAIYDAPQLDVPTLNVGTSDGYHPGFEEIVAFARVEGRDEDGRVRAPIRGLRRTAQTPAWGRCFDELITCARRRAGLRRSSW